MKTLACVSFNVQEVFKKAFRVEYSFGMRINQSMNYDLTLTPPPPAVCLGLNLVHGGDQAFPVEAITFDTENGKVRIYIGETKQFPSLDMFDAWAKAHGLSYTVHH